MFEFSCADFSFPLLSRLQVLRFLRLLEFGWVDVGLFERNAHFTTSEFLSSPTYFTQRVLDDMRSAELRVADVFLQIGLHPAISSANDPDPAVRAANREVFARTIDLCHSLGSLHMTGLPGVHHKSAENDFAIAAEEAAWRTEQCRQAGVVYSIEPHMGSICDDTGAVSRFLAAVPGLTLTLDYGHFICLGEDSKAVHPLLSKAAHLHARGAAKGLLQANTSESTIDFDGLITRLIDGAYSGKIALEYVWIDWENCNRSDNVSETILLRQKLRDLAEGKRGLNA